MQLSYWSKAKYKNLRGVSPHMYKSRLGQSQWERLLYCMQQIMFRFCLWSSLNIIYCYSRAGGQDNFPRQRDNIKPFIVVRLPARRQYLWFTVFTCIKCPLCSWMFKKLPYFWCHFCLLNSPWEMDPKLKLVLTHFKSISLKNVETE